MHPPIGAGVFTDFKSLNRIKISRLVQILLHFYWFRAPHPQGGGGGCSGYLGDWGWCRDLLDDVETTWGWWGQHGDDGDDVGMTGTMGTTWGEDHGDHSHGDHMKTFWGLWGQHGDDRDDTGMTGTMWGPRGQHGVETMETTVMGTTWGPSGAMGMMGMTRGQCGDHGDNEITKNAITFEQIEIIEFHLKIWDPWTLPHTCRLQLMYRWGGLLSQMAFLCKKCSGDPRKKNFPLFALDPIRPYLDWAVRGFLTSWPIYDPLKSQPKWKKSEKFD